MKQTSIKKISLFRYRMGGDNKHFQLCLVGCTMYILSYVISICSGSSQTLSGVFKSWKMQRLLHLKTKTKQIFKLNKSLQPKQVMLIN